MADKIVQLIDDQNNNIFPISRGLAANSVDTNAIQDGAVTSSKIDSATYSTNEKVVGTWVNGKPVYEKVINFGTLPSSTSKYVNHGISNLGLVVELNGTSYSATYGTRIPWFAFTSYGITTQITNTQVQIVTTTDASTFTETYVVLKYTKTTD